MTSFACVIIFVFLLFFSIQSCLILLIPLSWLFILCICNLGILSVLYLRQEFRVSLVSSLSIVLLIALSHDLDSRYASGSHKSCDIKLLFSSCICWFILSSTTLSLFWSLEVLSKYFNLSYLNSLCLLSVYADLLYLCFFVVFNWLFRHSFCFAMFRTQYLH